jgi:hypothetical protein
MFCVHCEMTWLTGSRGRELKCTGEWSIKGLIFEIIKWGTDSCFVCRDSFSLRMFYLPAVERLIHWTECESQSIFTLHSPHLFSFHANSNISTFLIRNSCLVSSGVVWRLSATEIYIANEESLFYWVIFWVSSFYFVLCRKPVNYWDQKHGEKSRLTCADILLKFCCAFSVRVLS